MNRLSITLIATLFFLSATLTSCEAIGSIFKAGIWVGVLAVGIVAFLIIFLIGKSKK